MQIDYTRLSPTSKDVQREQFDCTLSEGFPLRLSNVMLDQKPRR